MPCLQAAVLAYLFTGHRDRRTLSTWLGRRKPVASELFLTQCSRWEQINVPFLLSLLHFQTSEGREESKGYCTEETDGQDDSASAVLGQSVKGSVTVLKLGPFALPFSLAKGWIKFQGHSETGKLPPARGKWTGLGDEAGHLEANLPRLFLHSFRYQATQSVFPAAYSGLLTCQAWRLQSVQRPVLVVTEFSIQLGIQICSQLIITQCEDQVRHRTVGGGEAPHPALDGRGLPGGSGSRARGCGMSRLGRQLAGGLCS